MAERHPPQPAKLLAGLIAGHAEWLDQATALLAERVGPIDLVSPDWPFTFTGYYQPEMGPDLLRRFVAFEALIDPASLRQVKVLTNDLEAQLAGRIGLVRRPVNIDPGYVGPGKLVLASAKDYAHRIYLGEGIYAEVTLQWRQGKWHRLEWTFPDYASGLYDAYLTGVRSRLREQLHPHRPA